MGESDNCPSCRFTIPLCGICGKCGKQCAWAEGVTILLLSFLGFKIPRQQSPPTYLKVRAHNTVCPSVCGEDIDYLPCPLPLGWEGVSLPGGLETTVSAPPHASADAAQACRVSTASGAGTQRASLLPGTTVLIWLAHQCWQAHTIVLPCLLVVCRQQYPWPCWQASPRELPRWGAEA